MQALGRSHVLLTGPPGCGKTTVLQAVLDGLRGSGWLSFGFWTPEIRLGRTRQGFEARLLSGQSAVLASRERPGPARVGPYGVCVDVMDQLVVPEIQRGIAAAVSHPDVVLVLDEIGKMELLSRAFREAVLLAFNSRARVLGTVMARPHPFADALKARRDVLLVSVTPKNRESLPRQIGDVLAGKSGLTP